MRNNSQLIEKLAQFATLAREISDTWDELSSTDFNEMATEYPFEESFDDMAIAIRHWSDTQAKLLK